MVESEDVGVKRDIPVNSTGWKVLEEVVRRNGIVDPQVYWSVAWVKRFKGTAPAVPRSRVARVAGRLQESGCKAPSFPEE